MFSLKYIRLTCVTLIYDYDWIILTGIITVTLVHSYTVAIRPSHFQLSLDIFNQFQNVFMTLGGLAIVLGNTDYAVLSD